MEKAKKKRFGLIATVVLLVSFFVLTVGGWTMANQSTTQSNTLERVQRLERINWGVKADTKLFGLMDTASGEPVGFDVDIAKALTKQIGEQTGVELTPTFTVVTSSTRIQLLKNTNIDAFIATATITPEREEIIDFTKPYFNAGQSILVKDGSGINSIKDLDKPGAKILGVVGSNSVINVKKFAPKAQVIALGDYGQAMAALKAGQGDALTTDNGILYGMATENPGFSVVGGTFTEEPYGVAFDNNQPEMVAEANKALEAIVADGTYNKLVEKWFSDVPGLDWEVLKR
jgi:putative glutamine transport system substrate-binding protein